MDKIKGFMLNAVAKMGGIGRLWGFLEGKKTVVAGVATLLTGLAGIAGQLVPLIEGKDAAALLAFAKGLPADQSWLMVLAGLGALGIAGKLDRAANKP